MFEIHCIHNVSADIEANTFKTSIFSLFSSVLESSLLNRSIQLHHLTLTINPKHGTIIQSLPPRKATIMRDTKITMFWINKGKSI